MHEPREVLVLVLSRLTHVRVAPHGFMARCPAHVDRGPSLSIRGGRTRPILHCFAGCSEPAIWAAIDVEFPWHEPEPVFVRELSPLVLAAQIYHAQPAHLMRHVYYLADLLKAAEREIAVARAEATALGDTEEAWEILEAAALVERDVRAADRAT